MEWNWSGAEKNRVEQNAVIIVTIVKRGLESYVKTWTVSCNCSYIDRALYIGMLRL